MILYGTAESGSAQGASLGRLADLVVSATKSTSTTHDINASTTQLNIAVDCSYIFPNASQHVLTESHASV